MDYIEIERRVQKFRRRCGFTQEALAEAADLSTSYLSHIERATKKGQFRVFCSDCGGTGNFDRFVAERNVGHRRECFLAGNTGTAE